MSSKMLKAKKESMVFAPAIRRLGEEEQTWEEKFDEEFPHILTELGYDYPKGTDNFDNIKQFISQLLDKEAKRRKEEKLETAKANYEAGKKDQRLDVSTWKNIGKKYGYWNYFLKSNNIAFEMTEDGIKETRKMFAKEIADEVEKLPTEFPELESDNYDLGGKDFKEEVLKIIK